MTTLAVENLFEQPSSTSAKIVEFHNPDSIFNKDDSSGVNTHTSWVNFVEALKSNKKFDQAQTEEALIFNQQIKIALSQLLLQLPSTQKYIIETHAVDLGIKHKNSTAIRGFSKGFFGSEDFQAAKDEGVRVKLIKDKMQELGHIYSDYLESQADYGFDNIRTISLKRRLDTTFSQITLTYSSFETLLLHFTKGAQNKVLPIIKPNSFLEVETFESLNQKILDLSRKFEQISEQVAVSNMLLVVKIANKFIHDRKDPDLLSEYTSEGYFGLLKAVKRFVPQLENKLSTYARHWIENSIRKISQPTSKKEIKIEKDYNTFFSSDHYREEHRNLCYHENPVSKEFNEDLVDSHMAVEDYESSSLENLIEAEEIREQVYSAISTLKEQQQFVLKHKFGIGVPAKKIGEIAQVAGLTEERIRQIDKSAIKNLTDIMMEGATHA